MGMELGDVAANLTGSALLIGQELAWNEQRIHLKFSFHPTRYSDPELQSRSKELYGSSWTTRMLKDYNAQTYWASFRLRSYFPKSRIPDWLCLSIGTGADGLWGGYNNWKTDENGSVVFDRSDIARSRQWYLAPDIDFTRIPTKKMDAGCFVHPKCLQIAQSGTGIQIGSLEAARPLFLIPNFVVCV